nr:MAG TPA: hypothetical protein [Caudoviricetes sp.]
MRKVFNYFTNSLYLPLGATDTNLLIINNKYFSPLFA